MKQSSQCITADSSELVWMSARAVLAQDFQPIDDMRASAAYRLQTAQALLAKALHEANGHPSTATRLIGQRWGEVAHAP